MCQPQFDALNFPTTNGHYLAMGTDAHRLELATNGNALAIYYNTLNNNYPAFTGAQQAANIDTNAVQNFTSNGPKPNWVVLNEISSSLWQNDSVYRGWVRDVVHALHATYGYNVVLYAPFTNPGNNNSDWQAVQADAYIEVENYLSGQDIAAQGFSVSWCQGQYQSSLNSYSSVGVPAGRLILGEHFSQTVANTGYGRSGVSSNDWDSAIEARSLAAQNCVFAGYGGYAWDGDGMGVSTNEMIHFEGTYAGFALPRTNVLTAPFAVLPPQSQTIPAGGSATFIVFQAGTAPTTFQWRYNGANLAGANTSALTIANLQETNAGSYTVVMSNAVGSSTSAVALLNVAVPPPFAFEPFAPGVTAYSVGSNLIGQTNAAGMRWTQAGTNGPQPTILGGSLAGGGLAGPSGNSVTFGGNGISARFNPGTNTSSGTWYFSFLTRLTDISTLNTGGIFWAGFNNSSGSQTNTPTSVATRVLTRSATGGYNIGLDKTSGTGSLLIFSTNVFTTNDTVFLVGSYTFVPTTNNDDFSQLWINPSPASFGQASAPAPTLTSTNGNDISQIASFVLFNRNANEPASVTVDELRLGASWASVTQPAGPQPSPVLGLGRTGANSVLSWLTNTPGFVLETASPLASPSAWTGVVGQVYAIGSQYVVTNSTASTNAFYRLHKP
ncbi:MAG: hypothetical protein C5B50_15120 [Verrucomicrobia bacterium]|nr:MAG: hypothetical protein C5B50_15120 [Verrucomicrobiota bacterium]